MKNKGFTLIELLAVITILTIILLITFASIGSVVRNSKNNLHKTQINQIEKAAEYYNNKEGLKDYDICINVSDLIDEGYIKQDEVKDPKSGKNIDGSVNIKYNGKKYSYEYQEKVCYYTYINLLEDIAPTGLSEGDKYEYQVNDTDTFKFYVLSIEDDKVNLIMDRNICTNGEPSTAGDPCLSAWHAGENNNNNNNYGPDTAMSNLYQATKDWTNVPNMIMEYVDENNNGTNYGYTGITTEKGITTITGKNGATNTTIGTASKPLKARLPREDEVTSQDAGCHVFQTDADSGTCSTWLVENLEYSNVSSYAGSGNTDKYNEINSNNGITNIYGYWLLSSVPGGASNARNVSYYGHVDFNITSLASSVGVRPVITVSLSDISN